MPNITDLHAAPSTEAEALATDRRRPGRLQNVSPELIPLLRAQQPPPPSDASLEFDEPDQMMAARGMVAGVVLAAPLWLAIFVVGRWIFS